jgi:hypothetical protein
MDGDELTAKRIARTRVFRRPKAGVASGKKSREFLAAEGALRLIKAYDRFPGNEMRTAFVELVGSIAKRGKARRQTAAGGGDRHRLAHDAIA